MLNGSLMLDKQIYRQFNHNAALILRALATVSITGLSMAITMKYTVTQNESASQYLDFQMMAVAFSTVLVGWMMWSFITKVICQLMGSKNELRDKMRSIGIAYVPGPFYHISNDPSFRGIHFILGMDMDPCHINTVNSSNRTNHPLKGIINQPSWVVLKLDSSTGTDAR
ncbi:MAG: hypothetical protein CM1200mP3_07530 [Chloroflexota bacterium]|nr:MAG: hypothetical protein CM1200mP3_07530 [Chloroflexota bacterium]